MAAGGTVAGDVGGATDDGVSDWGGDGAGGCAPSGPGASGCVASGPGAGGRFESGRDPARTFGAVWDGEGVGDRSSLDGKVSESGLDTMCGAPG